MSRSPYVHVSSVSSRHTARTAQRKSRFGAGWGVVLLAVTAALAPGCGSTGSSDTSAMSVKTGRAQRVRWIGYTRDLKFELVNASHTDRAELYSSTRSSMEAFTKVTSDEVLDEIVKQYRSGGFFERARPGPAPASAPPGGTQAIEVDDAGTVVHWAPVGTIPAADAELFARCRSLLVTVYSETLQLQSVDKTPDFDAQNAEILRRTKRKNP